MLEEHWKAWGQFADDWNLPSDLQQIVPAANLNITSAKNNGVNSISQWRWERKAPVSYR